VMQESMLENFGNPSSTHQFGRKAKNLVETARKSIANLLNASATEIIFTAGGTEADNLILHNAVTNLGVKRMITSKIEHHAVLHTVAFLKDTCNIEVDFVDVLPTGDISLKHLEDLLKKTNKKTLVSLMYINNEIGNILPLKQVCDLCNTYNALFHSDTVQAVGHYTINLRETPVDFIVASAHKFHGPKGVGFAYFKKGFGIQPMFHGGDQEKGARSSTENVHGILGMEKAFVLASNTLEKDNNPIIAPDAKIPSNLKSLSCIASKTGLYAPNSTKIKEPEIPGKIIAQIAIIPAKNKNQGEEFCVKTGFNVVM
jgi:cysteine desulfurase